MDTLGQFKTNFLSDRSSFKIGFNNRSPLSQVQYSKPGSSMQHSYTIPKLGGTIGKDGQSILVPDNSNELRAAEGIGAAIGKAGAKIGKAIEKSQKRKSNKKEEEEKKEEPKYKKGTFAHKLLDPTSYQNYITAKGEATIKDVDFDNIFSVTTPGVHSGKTEGAMYPDKEKGNTIDWSNINLL